MSHNSNMGQRLALSKGARLALTLAAMSIICTSFGVAYFSRSRAETNASPPVTPTSISNGKIVALGRVEPQGEVIQLSAPAELGSNPRIAELRAVEGEFVPQGEIVAILDSHYRLQGMLKEAQEQVKVAQARLAQVQAGASQDEIAAKRASLTRLQAQLKGEERTQQATINRLMAELKQAQTELARNQSLYQEGALSNSDIDSRALEVATTQAQLDEAEANLDRTVETLTAQVQEATRELEDTIGVRPTDIAVAQAEVDQAIATVERTQADLELTQIRTPRAGEILEVHTQAGETIKEDGIVSLGRTDQMFVVAEVYETDISKIETGQTAAITSFAVTEQLQGTVESIGQQVRAQSVVGIDPRADVDARVVEVKIRLDSASSKQVANLTDAQVEVEINAL